MSTQLSKIELGVEETLRISAERGASKYAQHCHKGNVCSVLLFRAVVPKNATFPSEASLTVKSSQKFRRSPPFCRFSLNLLAIDVVAFFPSKITIIIKFQPFSTWSSKFCLTIAA